MIIILGRYADIFILRYVDNYVVGIPTSLIFVRSRCLTQIFWVDILTGTEGIRRETLLSLLESMVFDMLTYSFDTALSLIMLTNESLFCNNSTANE